MKVKNVTIVGGGSSGWMSAAALSKLCPHLKITLVESSTIGTVGVGESTLGHINRFLRMLGLKDEDWMAACNATYKNSIRFTNFREKDGTFFEYPFTQTYDFTHAPKGLQTWGELSALWPDIFTPDTFSEFYAPTNTLLAKFNRESDNKNQKLKNYSFDYDTAYHLDAALFGQWLKDNIAIPNGVIHKTKDVHSYIKNDQGELVEVLCTDGTKLYADLWIDCTGFKSLLLEEWMGSYFVPFKQHLANDRALACRIPYTDRKNQMHNVTDCHAMDNGWVWTIPLWNRIGTGYVYSSRFVTDADAEKEFREHIAKQHSPKIAEEAKMFQIHIKHGKRKRAWVKNVVGVGLSYGFVEPLESTGLLTTHENIIKLVDILNRRDGYTTRTEREAFNFAVDYDLTTFRDFVSMHYAFSKRTDTHYWRWCTQLNEYHPDMHNDFVPQANGYTNYVANLTNHAIREDNQGMAFVGSGLGLRTVATPEFVAMQYDYTRKTQNKEVDLSHLETIKNNWLKEREAVVEYIKTLPTHYEYLRDNIYGGKDIHDAV